MKNRCGTISYPSPLVVTIWLFARRGVQAIAW